MKTFIFAGGGTGGHIFPALAIHEQLQELAGDKARSLFVCSSRPLDAEILRREGVPFRIIPARPFSVRPIPLVRFVWTWGGALRAARQVIREAGANAHIIAMGGFVAAPVARAAAVERAPVTLVNMDAVPGKANRWVASMAQHVFTSAPVPARYQRRWRAVPPIVRNSAIAGMPPPQCRAALGLDPARLTLLVTGASQGARSINRLLIRLVRDRPELLRSWQIIHQTGAGEDAAVRDTYAAAGIPALIQPFFEHMGPAWGAADLAVSRAGAGSVAEAWANHTPTLFLPYPYHRDQHQRHNAQPLEAVGGAVIATDRIDEHANAGPAGPGAILDALIRDAPRRDRMRAALRGLGPADGARRIAVELLRSGR